MEKSKKTVTDNKDKFCLSLFKNYNSQNLGKNILISPIHLYYDLGILSIGSKAGTLGEILKFFEEKNITDFNKNFEKIYQSILSNKNFHSSDIIFTNLKPLVNFSDKTKKFSNTLFTSEMNASTFNLFAYEKTNKRIDKLVPQKTVLIKDPEINIINITYFENAWKNKFISNLTTKETFFGSNEKNSEVEMMTIKSLYEYYEEKNKEYQIIDVPFLNGFSALFILPLTDININDFIDKKLTGKFLKENLKKFKKVDVVLKLPKIKFDEIIEFKNIIKSNGLNKSMDPKEADFSGIGENLFINSVQQKIIFSLDEEMSTKIESIIPQKKQETKNQKIVINEKDVQMTMNKPFIMIIKNESFDKFRFLFLGKFESF